MSIKAVIFDLDDTLYPEIDYVKSGFRAVGEELGRRYGIPDGARRLYAYFVRDRADVFGRILRDAHAEYTQSDIDDLVGIYREHEPEIKLPDETRYVLGQLRKRGYRLGVITDGRPQQQRGKIRSLGLERLVDEIVITDELGGVGYRKPDPAAFLSMCKRLSVLPQEMLYVGDNPEKDFAIGKYLPIRTACLVSESGLYGDREFLFGIRPDFTIKTLSEIYRIAAKDN